MSPFPWIVGGALVGVLAGPRIRSCVFYRGTESGQPPRQACPDCGQPIVPARHRWRSLLPVTGRCPACRAKIGPSPLLAELTAGLAMTVVAARASSVWELAALAWLVLLAVPLAFIDKAVKRLPNPLTAAALTGTLVLLIVAAVTGHTRLAEAREQGRGGEIAGLEVSIAAAGQKIAAMDQMTARHQVTHLGMPDFRPSTGRSSGATGGP